MTALSNGQQQTFDLNKARAAARAEAKAEHFPFVFGPDDREFHALPMNDWPLGMAVFLSEGNLIEAIRLVLAEGEFTDFLACTPTFGDLNLLFGAIGEWAGVGGLGNLSPPPQLGSIQT